MELSLLSGVPSHRTGSGGEEEEEEEDEDEGRREGGGAEENHTTSTPTVGKNVMVSLVLSRAFFVLSPTKPGIPCPSEGPGKYDMATARLHQVSLLVSTGEQYL